MTPIKVNMSHVANNPPNTLKIYCNSCFSDPHQKTKKKKENYCRPGLQGQLCKSSSLSLFAPRHKSLQEGAQSVRLLVGDGVVMTEEGREKRV